VPFLPWVTFPHQGRRLGHGDEKDAGELRVFGPVGFGQFMVALAGDAVDQRETVGFGPGTHAPAEGARHGLERVAVQMLVGAVEGAPEVAHAAALLAAEEVTVEDEPIDAIRVASQGFGGVGGEVISWSQGERLTEFEPLVTGCAERRFFPAQSGKKRGPPWAEIIQEFKNIPRSFESCNYLSPQ